MEGTKKIVFMPLGAGAEVGRSCMYLSYESTKILMDVGIHPAFSGPCSLPFIEMVDLSKVDAIFITHFHLDHAGGLPYVTEKTDFNGKVYMTHPTKAILKYLLNDYIRVVNASSNVDFYTEKELESCYKKIVAVDYHQEVRIKDICIQCFNAGHVLGAAMLLIKLDNKKFLYTGDYSTEDDRHLRPAKCPGKVDYLATESTYGVQCHLPRKERELRFTGTIRDILKRNGKVLLPVFALGRAQELLLILEEYWDLNIDLRKVPIFYASALAKKCIGIYQAYSNTTKKVDFNFKYIRSISHFEDQRLPCVVMASPGMLQSGLSRELFEKWCEDSRNGVIIAGYCVQGTLAKDLLNEPEEVESLAGGRLKVNCTVDCISFSAHVDYLQNKAFINDCDPEILFLVHGEFNEMTRLKNALKRENIFCLKNGESHLIEIERKFYIQFKDIPENEEVDVILKENGDVYDMKKIEETDHNFIKQKIEINNIDRLIYNNTNEEAVKHSDQSKKLKVSKLTYNHKYSLINSVLNDFFDNVKLIEKGFEIETIKIHLIQDRIEIEWEGSYKNDLLASAISRMIQNIGKNIECIKICKENKQTVLLKTLKSYFAKVQQLDTNKYEIQDGKKIVFIENDIITGDEDLKERVQQVYFTVTYLFK